MKLDRLLGIIMLLIQQKSVTAKGLADHFSVSIRTIQRDIDTLSVAGIPITSLKGPGGGYGLLDAYTIDKTFLKAEEYHLLTDLLKGLENIISGPMRNLTDKVKALSPEKDEAYRSLVRFDFMPWLPHQTSKEKIDIITEAITTKRLVSITYTDQNGNVTSRILECYQLWLKENAWYVQAYCREKQAFRIFKLSRIETLQLSKELYAPRTVTEQDPFGHLKTKLVELTLKFSFRVKGRLEDYFFKEDITNCEDGFMVITKYPEDDWLYQTLLSFGTDVEVLEPIYIREKLKLLALGIAQRNG